jgi:saccharopine dehydrogenase (NAD+, L-lysine-forming)
MRFHEGKGTLYDLEFLQEENGRRVAAFGFHAGFAGAAAACLALAKQVESNGGRLGALEPYPNEAELVKEVRAKFTNVKDILGRNVRALVIGALGRCGKGAVSFLQKAGLEDADILKWDMAETSKGGPFQELLDGERILSVIVQ